MKPEVKFPHLFQPVRIGTIELKNRLLMLPMENNYAAEDGSVSERIKNYYYARSKDVGLIIVQITCVDAPVGKAYRYQLCIDNDRLVPGLTELAGSIHKGGAKAFIQLHHAGVLSKNSETVAASAVAAIPGRVPRSLTIPEIEELIQRYVAAAQRAKKAGFDGVEVVCSGNYLVWNFMSPVWNKRTDKYGGDLNGRARLYLEIIQAIKASLGKDYPISSRLAIREYNAPGGMTVKDMVQVAKMAETAGLDCVTMTAVSTMANIPTYPGALVPLAAAVKQVVSIPVVATGRMDLDVGDRVVREGKADLVGIARRLITDPDCVGKAAAGKTADIRPCIACLQCVNTGIIQNVPLRCAVNPAAGKEKESVAVKAEKPKKVVVVGAGPAGMQAAVTAAQRGHQVELYDAGNELGGQLILAAIPPGKSLLANFNLYLARQIKKFKVKVELGKEATPETILADKPDAVILAAGVKSIVPKIPGMEKAHVVMAEDVLTGKVEVGMEVVVIGGDMTGCETAEFLVDRDRKVTVVEILPRLCSKGNPVMAHELQGRLKRKGVTAFTGVKREEFRDNTLIIITREDEEKAIEVNTIVMAAGVKPNNSLLAALQGRVPEIYTVGDCVEPRNIMEATTDGLNIGLKI